MSSSLIDLVKIFGSVILAVYERLKGINCIARLVCYFDWYRIQRAFWVLFRKCRMGGFISCHNSDHKAAIEREPHRFICY